MFNIKVLRFKHVCEGGGGGGAGAGGGSENLYASRTDWDLR